MPDAAGQFARIAGRRLRIAGHFPPPAEQYCAPAGRCRTLPDGTGQPWQGAAALVSGHGGAISMHSISMCYQTLRHTELVSESMGARLAKRARRGIGAMDPGSSPG